MPEQPDNYEPTEADLDLVIEAATGKPAKPVNFTAGIASIRQRIAQFEAEKARLLDRMGGGNSDATLKDYLTSLNKDLASARERLAHCQAKLDKQN